MYITPSVNEIYDNEINDVNLDFLLTFYLKENDLLDKQNELYKIYPKSKYSISLYMGARLALDMAFEYVNVNFNIFDSQNDTNKIYNLIQENKIPTDNILIGPLYSKNIKFILNSIEQPMTIISPLSEIEIDSLKKPINLVKANVDEYYMVERMLEKVYSQYSNQRVFIFGGFLDNAIINKTKEYLCQRNDSIDIKVIFSMDEYFDHDRFDSLLNLYNEKDYHKMGVENRENLFVIATKDTRLTNDIIVNLVQKKDIPKKVFAILPKDNFYEKLDTDNLKMLNFSYPTAYHVDYNSYRTKYFIKRFVNKFYQLPNKYAILGFDLVHYLINNNINKNNINQIIEKKAIGIGNKFNFYSTKDNIFKNKGGFIVKYSESSIEVE